MGIEHKLKVFEKAFKELTEEWCESDYEFTKDYPFERSFDEINYDIHAWVKQCKIEIKNKQDDSKRGL